MVGWFSVRLIGLLVGWLASRADPSSWDCDESTATPIYRGESVPSWEADNGLLAAAIGRGEVGSASSALLFTVSPFVSGGSISSRHPLLGVSISPPSPG